MSGLRTVEHGRTGAGNRAGHIISKASAGPCGPAGSAAFGVRCPSFSLPDGLYPNHRIPFHQHQESPLQQNQALRAPRVPSEDGRLIAAPDSMLIEAGGHDRSVQGIFRFRDYLLSGNYRIKLLL